MARSYSRRTVRPRGLGCDQRETLLELVDNNWRSTRWFAARTPWSVKTVGDRLRQLEAEGKIECGERGRGVTAMWRLVRNGVLCPQCGSRAIVQATQHGRRDKCCGLWSWGGKPLVDAETHELRKAAHEAFDPLWQSRKLTRNGAYALLRKRMGMTPEECHMATMGKDDLRRVPEAVEDIVNSLELEHPQGDPPYPVGHRGALGES